MPDRLAQKSPQPPPEKNNVTSLLLLVIVTLLDFSVWGLLAHLSP